MHKLRTEASIRNELKQEFERNISELVAKLNEISAAIQGTTKKEVLVIIDDLDKLDLAVVRSIFQEHIKALFLPGFSIIYTIPISSLRDISLSATLRTEADDQKDLRLDFETTLGKADYTIFKETYEKFLPEDPKEQAFLDLLHGLDILEYRNSEVWYDVHPIVMDLLQRKGLINVSN